MPRVYGCFKCTAHTFLPLCTHIFMNESVSEFAFSPKISHSLFGLRKSKSIRPSILNTFFANVRMRCISIITQTKLKCIPEICRTHEHARAELSWVQHSLLSLYDKKTDGQTLLCLELLSQLKMEYYRIEELHSN